MKRSCYYMFLVGDFPGRDFCQDGCEDCKYFLTWEQLIGDDCEEERTNKDDEQRTV